MSFLPVFILTSLLGFMEGWAFGIVLGIDPEYPNQLGVVFLGMANYCIFGIVWATGVWMAKTGKV